MTDVLLSILFIIAVVRIGLSVNMLCRMDPDGPAKKWILDRFGWFRIWPRRVRKASVDQTSGVGAGSADGP